MKTIARLRLAPLAFPLTAALTIPAPARADFRLTDGTNELVISGLLNAQGEELTTSSATVPAARPDSRSRLNQNGSELRFTVTRALAGDTQVFATVGSELQSFSGANGNNTSTFGLRNTGIGLRGTFGEVAIGRWDSHYHFSPVFVDQQYLSGPAAWSANSIISFVGTSELVGNRFANSLRYISPTFSGFTGHFIVSRGDGGSNNVPASGITAARDTSVNVAATYRTGPLSGFVSLYDRRDFIMNLPYAAANVSSLTAQRSARAGVKYGFPGGVSVGVVADTTRELHEVPGGTAAFAGSRDLRRTAWAVPAEWALGAHRVSATYGKAGEARGALLPASIIGTNSDTGASFSTVGYKYWWDSNTNIHVGWARLSNQMNAAYDLYLNGGVGTDLRGNGNARGTNVQSFDVGLYYRF